jgi:glutamate racemase
MDTRPIGVFDSGLGGLSVLRALRAELSHEQFVYVSDSGHAPYGERDDSHVIERSQTVARFLIEQHHIKALVVACNTATAAAIKHLRAELPDRILVGIEPALKPAVALSKTGHIGVMATRGTLQSEKFQALLQSLEGRGHFVLQACDGLADAIERADAIKIRAMCAHYTGAMGSFGSQYGCMDTLVLGCTHYPLVADILQDLVGPDVAFLEGGAPVARHTHRLLTACHGLAPATAPLTTEPLTFYTTGHAGLLQQAVQQYIGVGVPIQTVDLPQATTAS